MLESIVSILLDIHKDIFACLFSIHNIISLSCHEQVLVHGMINLLYYIIRDSYLRMKFHPTLPVRSSIPLYPHKMYLLWSKILINA